MKRAMCIIILFAVGTVTYFGGISDSNTSDAAGITKAIETVQPMEIDKGASVPDGFIDIASEEFSENYLDLRTVTEYIGTETGLMLYTENGYGYFWEVSRVEK